MKTILTAIAFVLLTFAALIPDAADPVPSLPGPGPLADLLPASTVAAVEVRDVAARWEEIRSVPGIGAFQERLLNAAHLEPDDLPRLLGDRAVFALVATEDGTTAFPLAILRPPRPGLAARLLEPVCSEEDGPARMLRRGRSFYVAPAEFSERLPELANGPTRGRPAELERRLPGGLARGWVDPGGLAAMLRNQPDETRPSALGLVRSLLVGELETVRFAGFRRDLRGHDLVTDAVVDYDTELLPREVLRALRSTGAPAVLPEDLPQGVVAMVAFRPESEASLAWLRHVSASDPRGPLRNLDFWLDEFARRYGRDLDRELVGLLGERGWLFVLEGHSADTVELVVAIETPDARRLERTLLDLRSWMLERGSVRSLGLALPRARDEQTAVGTVHRIAWWTPLGEVRGPDFLGTERHMLIGSGERALRSGFRLLSTQETWAPPRGAAENGPPPSESVVVGGPALAGLAQAVLASGGSAAHVPLAQAVGNLLAGLDRVSVGLWFEQDGLRVRGTLSFGGRSPGSPR